MKTLCGYVYEDKNGCWFCRFDYTDSVGKRRTVRRRAENKTKAKELLGKLLNDFKERGQRGIDGERMTFAQFASYYEKTYLIEPIYVDGRKVAGLRSSYDARFRVALLKKHFAKKKLREITYSDVDTFRTLRLNTPTKHGKQRTIATVNRELSFLRRMFNVAVRNGWLQRNPLQAGDSLISPGDEKARDRVMSRDEEERLLAACVHPRAHLRPIILCAVDTGMRRGEILKLRWSDVNFFKKIIMVRAFNTKTLRERQVPMTNRLLLALVRVYKDEKPDNDDLIFGFTNSFKRSFKTAKRIAEIDNLTFHDLRHTAATRLIEAGLSLAEVGRLLGHTQPQTTYRYINTSEETLGRAATALNQYNLESQNYWNNSVERNKKAMKR